MKKENILKVLKTIGKVIIIVYACIGLICTAILGVNAIRNYVNNNNDDSPQQLNVVAITPVKEVAKRDNVYMFGYNEIASREALDSVLYWANNLNTYYSGFASCDNTFRYYNLLQDSPLTPISDNMSNTFLISQIGSSGAPTTIFNARKITFYSTIINAQNFRRWYYFISFGNDGNTEAYNIEYNLFTDISNSDNVNSTYSTLFNVTIKHTLNGSTFTDLDTTDYAYSFFENSTCYFMYSQLVNQDYTEYQNGFQYGYNEGYQNGYNVGRNDLNIEGANPFNIIADAFDSIANILDIKILPYLSLGTLIFVPLIISIVIVVVKVVKG